MYSSEILESKLRSESLLDLTGIPGFVKEEKPQDTQGYDPTKDYKILVYLIQDFKIFDYTPFGVIDRGNSSLQLGFRVGVKERSPREDFNEQKDLKDESETNMIIQDYQNRYNVPDEEVYYCFKR